MFQTATLQLRTLERQALGVQTLWIAAFALATAAGAQIRIPHQPVPYTFQTLFVLLSGAFLGKRNGALSQVLYLSLGLIGLPVFTGFAFGPERLLGPTGGYLLSFPVAAFVAGTIAKGSRSVLRTSAGMLVAMLVIFSLGTLQLSLVWTHDLGAAFAQGFLIFSWWDALKIAAAVLIVHRTSRLLSPGSAMHA
jgi:biotin transport system substrate-specific component